MDEILTVFEKLNEGQCEQIVRMELMGVPVAQICIAVGLELAEFGELTADDRYMEEKQKISLNDFLFNKNINDGWDSVERLALSSILQKLQFGSDPNFALRAAMLANKVTRKGMHEQEPLNGNGEHVAKISLNKTFVTKIQNIQINHREATPHEIPKKQQDFLEPAKVESMLMVPTGEQKAGALDGLVDGTIELEAETVAEEFEEFLAVGGKR